LWRLAVDDAAALVATGGNDCCPKLTSLAPPTRKALVLALPFVAATSGDDDAGGGSPEAKRAKQTQTPKAQTPKAKKGSADPVVGIRFVAAGVALAAQSSGALWRLSHDRSARVTVVPLPLASAAEDDAVTSSETAKVAWSAFAVRGCLLAVGTSKGQLHVYGLSEDWGLAEEKYAWDGSGGQRLLGLWFCGDGGDVLVSATPDSQLRVWRWRSDPRTEPTEPPSAERSLKLSAAASVASVCFVAAAQCLVVGDSRGHLSVFATSTAAVNPAVDALPTRVLRRVHGTHQVAHLLLRGKYLYSCGFDGWVHTFEATSKEPYLAPVASQPAGPISSVAALAFRGGSGQRLVAAGFHGPDFVVFDLSDSCEVLRIDCGGSKRPFACELQPQSTSHLPAPSLLWANTGADAIEIWSHVGCDGPKSLGGSFHGRELTCAAFCGRATAAASVRVVTGGQDCLAKLVEFGPSTTAAARVVQHLAPHPTAVRAVVASRWHPESPTALVVSGGGKLALKFWRVWNGPANEEEEEEELEAVPCHLLASLENCAGQDHRVLSVAALPWQPVDSKVAQPGGAAAERPSPGVAASNVAVSEMLHVVASGDSEGRLSVFLASETSGAITRLSTVPQRTGPVLSLALARLARHVLCVAGSTSGDVAVWDVSPLLEAHAAAAVLGPPPPPHDAAAAPMALLFRVSAHQCGANALAVSWRRTAPAWTPEEGASEDVVSSVLCVVSGGDDQALSVTRLGFTNGSACVAAGCERLAGASGSALKGVCFAAEGSRILTVGYDQRLSVWRLHPNQPPLEPLAGGVSTCPVSVVAGGASGESQSCLAWVSAALTDVADVGGLAVSEDGTKALVFGQGAQLFDVHA
jgi:WD40 repeat protein